ncbi:DUF86 domain-containing protein [Azonexus sp.]|uniref:HepT-like ribonuclease domain-containing protein n=1 Tax=Azonexus sp. TaxID=1872668 RepID=UPI0027B9F70D|nr:DUF86 domain-containing protein [Azonexus sp.]
MKAVQRDAGYLDDILLAIGKINRYVNGMDLADFVANDMAQDAVLRNIAIIGEAVGKLSKDLTARYPEVPWINISGMRNRLVHEYNGVNLKMVWNTIQQVLPDFHATIQAIRSTQQVSE